MGSGSGKPHSSAGRGPRKRQSVSERCGENFLKYLTRMANRLDITDATLSGPVHGRRVQYISVTFHQPANGSCQSRVEAETARRLFQTRLQRLLLHSRLDFAHFTVKFKAGRLVHTLFELSFRGDEGPQLGAVVYGSGS